MNDSPTRNTNADGTFIARGDADCTIHAEICETDGGPMVRLNCTSPWDTWIGVDLYTEQVREMAANLLRFADEMENPCAN